MSKRKATKSQSAQKEQQKEAAVEKKAQEMKAAETVQAGQEEISESAPEVQEAQPEVQEAQTEELPQEEQKAQEVDIDEVKAEEAEASEESTEQEESNEEKAQKGFFKKMASIYRMKIISPWAKFASQSLEQFNENQQKIIKQCQSATQSTFEYIDKGFQFASDLSSKSHETLQSQLDKLQKR